MLRLLNVDTFTRSLRSVTSTEIFTRSGDFNPEGLLSESIFGVEGSKERQTVFSYVSLFAKVIHPTALRILYQLDRKIEQFLSTEDSFALDANGRLKVTEGGITGINGFMKLFSDIKFRGETSTREKLISVVQRAYKDGTLFIDKIPVIPVQFRNAYKNEKGQWVVDPLNDYYISIMRRGLQIKSAAKEGPLFDLLNYGLQLIVIEHDNYVRNKIQKKDGLVRHGMLGKRVDFSGRAVITPGPDLKVDEIGVPLRVAVRVFEPFIIHQLLYSGRVNREELEKEVQNFTKAELSVESVQRVIKALAAGDFVPKALFNLFFEATEIAMMGRVVLAKRDPTLHALSYRAFKPILVKGDTVQMSTLHVGGFNADFDGDAMAIFHPLTEEAQREAREKMMRGKIGSSSRAVAFELSKEMCVGLYNITKDIPLKKSAVSVTVKDLETATDPYLPVVFRRKTTTMGRAIVNSCFPSDYPFVDKLITRKVINDIIVILVEKYGDIVTKECVSKLEKEGFKWATIMAPSVSLDDLELPSEIYEMKKRLEGATPAEVSKLLDDMRKIVVRHLKDTGLFDLVESGSTRGWDQPMQILVAKGIIADPQGRILEPIKGSFSDGLTNKEYFKASSGARKGIIDRVINTADTGYMSRKLAYVLNTVEADPRLVDCGAKKYLNIKLDRDLITRINGRFLSRGGKTVEFDLADFKVGQTVELRSPIYCRSPKVCHTCYGRLLARHGSPYIGLVAAQTIGERGTQLIMRTFHTGGQVKVAERDILKDIEENEASITVAELRRYLRQTESFLVCLRDCSLTIDLSNYNIGDNLKIGEENKVWAKSLMARLKVDDLEFSIILDYEVDIQAQRVEKVGKNYLILRFVKGNTILEAPLETQELKAQVHYVERLLGGKETFKDVDHLFRKLFKVYGPISDIDVVHLEVLLSNCLRDRTELSKPARLGRRWDPVLINIKEVVFSAGFAQGLAFENVNKAIQTGLITEERMTPSVLERVLTGDLV